MPKARKKPIEPVRIRLKKNDLVEVLAGKEAGKTGKILKVTVEVKPMGEGMQAAAAKAGAEAARKMEAAK